MTDATTTVDVPHDAVMWTVKAVADRDGISKQAVSKRARKFADEQSLIVERDGLGRILRLNVVQYDQLRGRFGDPAKAQAPKPKAEQRAPAKDSFDEARRVQAWHDAELSRLKIEEAKRELIRVDALLPVIDEARETIAGVVQRLPNVADDLAAAVAREGSHGARVFLGQEATRLLTEIADALLAAKAALAQGQEVAPADQVTT